VNKAAGCAGGRVFGADFFSLAREFSSCSHVARPVDSTFGVMLMRVFILGATGGTGRQLVNQALARNLQVTAFVRAPQKLGTPRHGLVVRRGDPRNLQELADALPGHDALLSALGPPGLARTTILRDCASSIVAAMQAAGLRRLLVVSVGTLFENTEIIPRLLRYTFLKNVVADSAEMEQVIKASGLDWTIVRPPKLTNGPLTGRYAVAPDRLPPGKRWVSRANVAEFLLDELQKSAHLHQIVGMAG
jgi:putative NADH-flavin reductase